jgi:hypothetical protein
VGNSNIRQTFNFNHLKNLDNNLKELVFCEIVENLTAHLLQQNSSFHVLSVLRYAIDAPYCKHFDVLNRIANCKRIIKCRPKCHSQSMMTSSRKEPTNMLMNDVCCRVWKK